MWWIIFAVKIAVLLLVLQVGFYVHNYGWEKTLRDLGWLWGLAEGFFPQLAEMGMNTGNTGGGRNTRTAPRVGRAGRQQPTYTRGRWT